MRTVVLSLSVACLGCAGVDLVELEVAGEARSYYVRAPTDTSTALPVVLVFHGGGTKGSHVGRRMGEFTGFNDLADEHGFLAVYPNAWKGNWNDGRAFGESYEAGLSDVAYIDAVLDDVEATWTIDPERVFATGVSNGAFMSSRLACERADRFAGFAPVIGTMATELEPTCEPARAVPILYVLGTEDPLVPYDGGPVASDRGDAMGADDTVAWWADRWSCDAPVTTALPDLEDDDCTSMRDVHAGCDAGVTVERIEVRGGGHTWPGGSQYLPSFLIGPTTQDFSASEQIVSFFGLDR